MSQSSQPKPLDILAVYALHEISHREHFAGILRFFGKRPNWRLHVKEPGPGFTADDVTGKNGIRYDGFIISLPGTEDAMEALTRSDTPTVLVNITDRQLANRERNLSTVWLDNADIGRVGAQHFLQQGDFRSFGFLLAADGQFYSQEREMAFRAALASAGHASVRLVVPEGPDAVKSIMQWLNTLSKPAAVMCAEAKAALICHEACTRSGLSIPGQVAILSVNDHPAYARETGLSISCVLPDVSEMGYRAAEELDRIIRRKGRHTFREIVIPVNTVLARTSTKISGSPSHAVKEALGFIRAQSLSPIRVTDVVNHLGVSRRVLEAHFRKLLSSSIRTEIERERMNAVVSLLKQGESVQHVAQTLNFKSANALTRAFKRHFHCSIREWQKA